MVVVGGLPTLAVIVVTGLVDSINPCAIGVLILLISVLLTGRKSRGRMLKVGFAYVFAVFLTYLLAGIGLTAGLSFIPLSLAEYVSIAVAIVVVAAGILEIKDYFWYGRGLSLAISPGMAKRIHNRTKNITVPAAVFLGVFVAAVELPCTGGPYLAVITLLSQNFDFTAVLYLILYNIIFVSPLVAILLMVAGGKKLHNIKKWKHRNRSYMRLLMGLLLVYLGWLLILIANGTINLG